MTTENEIVHAYSENTITNVDKVEVSDNSMIDANKTQAKKGCLTRRNKIRRGGRKKST